MLSARSWSVKRLSITCSIQHIQTTAERRSSFSRSDSGRPGRGCGTPLLDWHSEGPETLESPHGTKYTLDGRIESPSGGAAMIRTIWIVDRGQDAPRLVTAYPHRELDRT